MIIIYSYWNYIILAAYKQAYSGHVPGWFQSVMNFTS